MIPFWLLFFFLVTLTLVFPNFSQKNKIFNINAYLFVFFSISILVFFAGFRYGSNDYSGYVDIYKEIPKINNLDKAWFENNFLNVEIGFIYFSGILKLFSENSFILFFFVALISVGLNIWAIKRISPYVYLSILLYFVYNFLLKDTIQIRQGLASSFVLASFIYHSNRKRSIILLLGAISFQATAIVALLLMFFSRLKFKSNKSYYLIIGSTFCMSVFFSGRRLFEFLMTILDLPLSLTVYFGWDEFDYNLGFFSPILVKQLIILYFLILYRYTLEQKFESFLILFNYYFFSTLWYIYFIDFAIVAGRISNLLSIGEIILVPMLISIFSRPTRNTLYILAIIYSALVLFLNLSSGKIFPYQTIFNLK